MKFQRMYTGSDGQSHIEDTGLNQHPLIGGVVPVESVDFRTTPAGDFLDWHHAPRRQFVIMLAGDMEVGLGDGSVHHFAAGDVLLAEDLTGQGHTRRIVGPGPRISATIPIE